MKSFMNPIGFAHTDAKEIPRHWSVSDTQGTIKVMPEYQEGLRDIKVGEYILVFFIFHKSPPFTWDSILQTPRNRTEKMGVFSICSPIRPNPLGMSRLEVLEVNGGSLRVKGIDMMDGTPIIDIKPDIASRSDCPSNG